MKQRGLERTQRSGRLARTAQRCLALAMVVGSFYPWCAGCFGAEPAPASNPRLQDFLRRFPQADLNGDGVLTADEAREARRKSQGQMAGKAGKGTKKDAQGDSRVGALEPAFANVSYGPHERNVLDFWKAESKEPTALIVFIHGGGFVGGDKAKANPAIVKACLDAGVSFMAINYRFRQHAAIQDILRDAARALQSVRHNATKYNIDPKRIACYGGSAGAGTSLWLAAHDDLADPKNADPVLRQSSRIAAAGCLNGQATYDFTEWDGIVGPFKPEWRRSPDEIVQFYQFKNEADLQTPEGKKILDDCNMLRLLTRDDPPVFMSCTVANIEPTDRGQYVHHPRHALAVKKQCDAVGVECVTVLRDDLQQGVSREQRLLEFLFQHLKVAKPPQL